MGGAILALDLGTKTGWAAQPIGGEMSSGAYDFGTKPAEHPGMRYLRVRAWLLQMSKEHGPFAKVAYEQTTYVGSRPDPKGPNKARINSGVVAAQVHGGLFATVAAWCCYEDIPIIGYAPNTVRKKVFGNGGLKKQQALQRLRDMGHDFRTDDEGDAIAVLLCAVGDHVQPELV